MWKRQIGLLDRLDFGKKGYLPEIEHPVILTDIHPFKWLSMKFFS
jgi:hypothetical protein